MKMEAIHALLKRGNATDPNNDQNIGSARGGTSTSAFLSTLVVNLLIFVVLVTIFILLRRSNKRIYAPRTYVGTYFSITIMTCSFLMNIQFRLALLRNGGNYMSPATVEMQTRLKAFLDFRAWLGGSAVFGRSREFVRLCELTMNLSGASSISSQTALTAILAMKLFFEPMALTATSFSDISAKRR